MHAWAAGKSVRTNEVVPEVIKDARSTLSSANAGPGFLVLPRAPEISGPTLGSAGYSCEGARRSRRPSSSSSRWPRAAGVSPINNQSPDMSPTTMLLVFFQAPSFNIVILHICLAEVILQMDNKALHEKEAGSALSCFELAHLPSTAPRPCDPTWPDLMPTVIENLIALVNKLQGRLGLYWARSAGLVIRRDESDTLASALRLEGGQLTAKLLAHGWLHRPLSEYIWASSRRSFSHTADSNLTQLFSLKDLLYIFICPLFYILMLILLGPATTSTL